MRTDSSVVLAMLRIAYRADAKATTTVLVLAFINAVAVAATGLSVRNLSNAAGLGAERRILLAAAIGALAYALIASAQRVQHNLQVDLTERVDLVLCQRLNAMTAGAPTLEHLERTDFLDRLSQIRSSTETLAGACWGAISGASSLLSLGLSAWLLAGVHPVLCALVLLAVPPLYFSRRASALLARARDESAEGERRERRLHRLCTSPGAAKELRISGSDQDVDRRASDYWDGVTVRLVRAMRAASLWQIAGWAGFAVGYLAALAFVADEVSQGRGTPGDLLMVASLSAYLRTQLSTTVTGLSQLAEGRHTIRHLRWLQAHTRQQAHRGTTPAPERLTDGIRLSGVTFTYPGTDQPVLRNVDLHLPAGSTVAVVGINGAGKTTLVKLLTGMYEPAQGDVLVDGVPLREMRLEDWRARTTAAFQDFFTLEGRVLHTVGVGDVPRVDDAAAVGAAVEAAQAGEVVERLPHGLDAMLGRTFGGPELSHGQWQKLALSRALMRTGPLLAVLDEPTAALDPQVEHELYAQFTGPGRPANSSVGGITLLVSHRFSTVRTADLIVVLDRGRVAELGTHDELSRGQGRYAELYAAQSMAYAP
ncbi:ATP-binding cassette domain-containing protein [Mangrovihabitans endophyticus]|uniref:ABC transporter permease n=1 Tax=Mangrovihabitans endophyticus TaxID=1751298 RepID=A0A8J3BWM7_9ACTN|nr:ABC transporter ATP-binding protein [Mangrovihabitans endophyticus]GGK72866.1 ABC transporter permease [Mangrovihabitans endophyticus]